MKKALYDSEFEKKFFIRKSSGLKIPLKLSRDLQTLAFEWAYRIRNRHMWASSETSRMDIRRQAREDLMSMGVSATDLEKLGSESVVEVNIPYTVESVGWELRIMPWEFFLSTAADMDGVNEGIMVIRRLEQEKQFDREPVSKTLLVLSSPGKIGDQYFFDQEKRILETSLKIDSGEINFQSIDTPTREELSQKIADFQPNIIHLSGVDSHEGANFLGLPRDKDRKDGFYLGDENNQPSMVGSQELAAILNEGAIKPTLITCNTYHSAARTCALNVAGGAEFSIGFQDVIDNTLAELFLSNFYHAWKVSGYETLNAFYLALAEIKRQPQATFGGGIILWSEKSLLEETNNDRVESNVKKAQEVRKTLEAEKQTPFVFTFGTGDGTPRDQINVQPIPHTRLNYTLLHNNQNLFESFKIRKFTLNTIDDLCVEVTLQIGSDQFHYRKLFDLKENVVDIADQIRVPLTWEFARTLKESVLTSLYVNVTRLDKPIFRDTMPIRLLSADEWLDTKRDGMWLPSFIQPRDRHIRRIVAKAQNYLMAINDDPDVGFDGYQSGVPDLVDLEARAIWSALVYDYKLFYIEPPPTYNKTSQRLRSHDSVINGQRGTCIDLALLFAACLEYIGLFPVIFLLKGHAFPGYWRDHRFRDRFFELQNHIPAEGDSTSSAAAMQLAESNPWMIGEEGYSELVRVLIDEELVPVETVCLTLNNSFSHAYETAIKAMNSRENFDVMLDIQTARKNGVTPIPMRGTKNELG